MIAASIVALGLILAPRDTVALTTLTVDGTDYPVCALEDCSDQPGQIGMWQDRDTGDWYLWLGEYSVTKLGLDKYPTTR